MRSLKAIVFSALFFSSVVAISGFSLSPANVSKLTQWFQSPSKIPSTSAVKTNHPKHRGKPIVILISIDGFRFDYMEMYKPATLLKLAQKGVRAEGIIPSFPSLTFPNHVSLITGRVPGNHGIVSNFFYSKKMKKMYQMNDGTAVNDASWYRGEPLWTAAEREGMLTGECFWVGSEANIGGVEPAYVRPYEDKLPAMDRSQQIISWLKLPEDQRPHFFTLYYSIVDSAGHNFGPGSKEVGQAIAEVDTALAALVDYTDRMKTQVNYVIVSDHGMEMIGAQNRINLSDFTDMTQVQAIERGAITHIYSEDPQAIAKVYKDLKANEKNFKVYQPDDLPSRWQYNDRDTIGDLIIVADPTYYLQWGVNFAPKAGGTSVATHGWDPAHSNMKGLFIASGPAFKAGLKIPAFQNVHVYPMILDVLDIKAHEPHDGNIKVLKGILR